ncbi:C39 family peptidase [Enterococcus pallens]|uniref:KxYKxGKxW signal peptide n=2 Tax=Enterococcus TaxID=1350 RepID=R2SDM6_9ENTE|nr:MULTISPECIES: C39 family peptidase [Enterococcus]EOH86259.1 KxYKxGKxW signal peptide [Enterococcus pallens ATCC BAA-351]EOU09417.1 hypothetical protein I588_05263 [Enterococcus pallens ATCC BAA-351]MBO1340271.1 C39 family peptidase [Enterococcus sp. 665A]OJG76420.1 KxYKxGKxW signal peptide [Enterococcus pallens]
MEKKRYKMYKKGKTWLVAPIVFFGLLGVGGLAVQEQTVHAAEATVEEPIVETPPAGATEIIGSHEGAGEIVTEDSKETVLPETPVTEQPTVETPAPEETTEEVPKNEQEIPQTEDKKEETVDPTTVDESTEKAPDTTVEENEVPVEKDKSDTANKPSESKEISDKTTVNPSTSNTKPAATPAVKAAAQASVVPKATPKAEATIPIYRVYNPNSGEHLHTMNGNEKDFLVRLGWRYEGISMRVLGSGRELFRVYNPNSGEHFFTLNGAERDQLKSVGWRYEGIAWHTPWSGLPMYRVYNPNTRGAGAHHYTMDANERDSLTRAGWRYEGISWHTLGGAQPIAPVERILSVPYVSQYAPVFSPWGCAGAAMTMLLRYKGANVDLKYVQDNLPMYPGDKGGQKGNVYTGAGFGWVITPGSLTNYAKRWYGNVSNITGSTTQSIVDRIIGGNPVLYYGYSSYQKQGDTVRNHCKVIAGYKDNKFLVLDPLYYSSGSGAGTGGKNMAYDRGATAWVSITDFVKEWDGRAIGIK